MAHGNRRLPLFARNSPRCRCPRCDLGVAGRVVGLVPIALVGPEERVEEVRHRDEEHHLRGSRLISVVNTPIALTVIVSLAHSPQFWEVARCGSG